MSTNHIPQYIEDTIRVVPDAVLTDVFIRDLAKVVENGAPIKEVAEQIRDIAGINVAKTTKAITKYLKANGKLIKKQPAKPTSPPTSPQDELEPRRQDRKDNAWRDQLLRKADDTLVKNSSLNTTLVLENHKSVKGSIRFNEFAQVIEITASNNDASPWLDAKTTRQAQDADHVCAANWLENQGIFIAKNAIAGIIDLVAHQNAYDPLMDFVNGLKWDGKPRLTGWLSRLLGAESTPYVDAIGTRFLIGAIARALNPGCKMDTMLILEGEQGTLKSTVLKLLFGADWFTDEIHAIGSKDAAMQLQGCWLIEIPEMHAMNRADANAIKEWTTRTTDRYRPPYAKCIVEAPRRCVLAGTLNPEGSGYLKDHTGGRRFWPVLCHRIDLDTVRAERKQLFAEAKHLYDAGEQWWLTEEEEEPAKIEQAERLETDPWAKIIDDYCHLKQQVTTTEVMNQALGLAARDMNRTAQMRVAGYMIATGWKRIQRQVSGARHWYYVRRG